MPDTGSLDGDLRTFAANVAREITGPDGPAVPRLVIALSSRRTRRPPGPRDLLRPNATASSRPCSTGPATEARQPPDELAILDHLLAPMYIRVLSGVAPVTPAYADSLVDRLLADTAP